MPPGGKVTFSRKTNFFGSGSSWRPHPKHFFSPKNVLVSIPSGFRLSIAGRHQNLFLESRCFWGRPQSRGSSHLRPLSEDILEARWFGGRLRWWCERRLPRCKKAISGCVLIITALFGLCAGNWNLKIVITIYLKVLLRL